ncbi:hypothetical protein [Spirosoma jeollabukense]
MKKLLSLLSLGLLLSCTNAIYHVATVKSEQVKLIENDFTVENEHLRAVYNLWEAGGRMRFMLFNKTDQPLYIDWSKSFFVRNGNKTSYSQLATLPGKAPADTVRYFYQNMRAEPYRTTARANPLTEIPPQTYVAIADFPIQEAVLHVKTKEKHFAYTMENSPLRVGQALTYSFDKTMTDAHQIEHSFWVDNVEVLRIGQLTKAYGSLQKGKPDAMYAVEKRSAPGRTVILGVVITAGAVGALLLLLQEMLSGLTL